MDLNLVRTFLSVYRHQSYTLAANELNLTQPATSAAIKRLENEINKQLFIKKGRGIEPTSQAHYLANHFQIAVDTIELALESKHDFAVYCTESALYEITNIPNIQVLNQPHEQSLLFEHLKTRQVDLIIDTVTTKDTSLIIEELYCEPAVVICAKDHKTIQGTITKEMFYNARHIIYSARWNGLSGFEQMAKEPISQRDVALNTSSISSLAMLVSQTNHIGLISVSFAKKWSEQLNLQILPSPIELQEIPYHLIYHRRYLNDPKHKKLRQQIHQCFKKSMT
ncbi:LysR family transcriptional regulator [Photobacterium angustum]|uniref:LysR family transcriptional regulator n=1 Tax=Photobacterium angustum TaxID=661 RepID=A0A2S7VKC3_PHOAN|nr:LysR family transcriptional regulator [Photobacterium angustum]PQJ61951.1 LysR family transcriptional regulator [Photobacterium angustum]